MDLIERQAAIDTLHMDTSIIPYKKAREYADATILEIRNRLEKLPSAQPKEQHGRVFKGIVVEYPSYNTYPEYIGKPYFSIKYTENGQEFIGYGTYNPEVLSEYLKEYFMPSVQPVDKDINVSCKDTISRQAAIDKFTSMPTIDGLGLQPLITVDDAVNTLEKLPSTQQEIGESLYRYKCYITDAEGLQHEVVHVGDIRRVTGWDI